MADNNEKNKRQFFASAYYNSGKIGSDMTYDDFINALKSNPNLIRDVYAGLEKAKAEGKIKELAPISVIEKGFGITTTTPTTTTETEVVAEEETPQQGTPARTFPRPDELLNPNRHFDTRFGGYMPITEKGAKSGKLQQVGIEWVPLPNTGGTRATSNQPRPAVQETQIAPIDQQAGQVQGGRPISGDVLANAPRQQFQWSGQAPTKPVVQPQTRMPQTPEQGMQQGGINPADLAVSTIGSFETSLIGGIGSELKGIAETGYSLDKKIVSALEGTPFEGGYVAPYSKPEDSWIYQAGQGLQNFAEENLYRNPQYQGGVLDIVAQGGGSVASIMASSGFNPAGGVVKLGTKAMTNPQLIAYGAKQLFSRPSISGALMMVGQETDEARKLHRYANSVPKDEYVFNRVSLGESKEDASKAYDKLKSVSEDEVASGMIPFALFSGATEAIPMERLFSRLGKASKDLLISAFKNGGIQGAEEYAQEAIQQTISNIGKGEVYNEAQRLTEGIVESGEAGGATGFVLGSLLTALAGKRANIAKAVADGTMTKEEAIAELGDINKAQTLVNDKLQALDNIVNSVANEDVKKLTDLPESKTFFDKNEASLTNPITTMPTQVETIMDKIENGILISPESLHEAYQWTNNAVKKTLENQTLTPAEKGATLNILNGMLTDIDRANTEGQRFVEQVEEVSVQDRVPAVREGVKPLPQGQAPKGTATPSISQAKAIREENKRKQAGTTTLPSSGQTIITPAPATTEVATEAVVETPIRTDLDAKKADIEKRRQEELVANNVENVNEYIDAEKAKDISKKIAALRQPDGTILPKDMAEFKRLVQEGRDNMPAISQYSEAESRIRREIDAKYDAELNALEQATETQVTPTETPTGTTAEAEVTTAPQAGSVEGEVENRKNKQLEIINKENPAPNNYNTWVRSVEDIKTADEVFEVAKNEGAIYPDFTEQDMEDALSKGEVVVYSSYPIKNGVFVSPSKMNAQDYAGGKGGKIYSKVVKLEDVAWIDEGQGQYAKVEQSLQTTPQAGVKAVAEDVIKEPEINENLRPSKGARDLGNGVKIEDAADGKSKLVYFDDIFFDSIEAKTDEEALSKAKEDVELVFDDLGGRDVSKMTDEQLVKAAEKTLRYATENVNTERIAKIYQRRIYDEYNRRNTKPSKKLTTPQAGGVGGTNPALADVKSTAKALEELPIEAKMEYIQVGSEIDGTPINGNENLLSEAYHKAKQDGSSPELVQAIEQLLTPTQDAVQIEKASSVPVQSGTTSSQEVAKGEPQAEPQSTADKGQAQATATQEEVGIETQIENFGVPKENVKPVLKVIGKVFETLKQSGLTTAKTIGDWVGVGKGEEKTYSLKINGKDTEVRNVSPEVVNGFYSPLEKTINETKLDKLPAKQWADKFGKSEEAKWTGLSDWLAQQTGSVSKADIQQFLKDNKIQVVEVVKGESSATEIKKIEQKFKEKGYKIYQDNDGDVLIDDLQGNPISPFELPTNELAALRINYIELVEEGDKSDLSDTKFSQYQLEGEKENYKEVLVTMPRKLKSEGRTIYSVYDKNDGSLIGEYSGRFAADAVAKRENGRVSESKREEIGYEDASFKSTHFDEPNILVHLRMNTRTDADGNKILFLEEVQSDWGQTGKKEGFATSGKPEKILEDDVNISWTVGTARIDFYKKKDDPWFGKYETKNKEGKSTLYNSLEEATKAANEYDQLRAKVDSGAKTPTAPFVMDTNAWTKLGLKVALKEAVKQGATKIAWTTGEQQNDRYDLSKQVDLISYAKNNDGTYAVGGRKNGENIFSEGRVKPEKLQDYFGKEIAEKIINNEGVEGDRFSLVDDKPKKMMELSGQDLKVGGKGMKGFYGSPKEGSLGIVGNVAKSLFKQEPRTVEIRTESFMDIPDLDNPNEVSTTNSTQHSIDITPELIASVEGGQPLFKDAQAQYRIENGKNIVEAIKDFNGTPEATVALTHEIMHPTVVAIVDGAKEGNSIGKKHTQTILSEYNKANPNNKVSTEELVADNDKFKSGETTDKYRAVQEFIAESWEKYHTQGAKGFSKPFQEVLDQITQAFKAVYKTISGKDITPELRQMFDEILGKETPTTTTEVTLNTPNETTIKDIEKIENATEKGRELALSKPVNKWVKRAFDSFQDLSSRAKKAGIYDGTTLKIGGKEYTVDTPAKFKAFLAQSQANFDAINEAVKGVESFESVTKNIMGKFSDIENKAKQEETKTDKASDDDVVLQSGFKPKQILAGFRAGMKALGFGDKFVGKVATAAEDWTAKAARAAMRSKNSFVAKAANNVQGFIRNIARTDEEITKRRRSLGTVKSSPLVAMDFYNNAVGIVGNDPRKLQRVHQVLDPEAYEGEVSAGNIPRVTEADLNPDEKQLYDILRFTLDYIHDWHYQNGFIKQETYDKYKGTYSPRFWEDTNMVEESPELAVMFQQMGKALDRSYIKQRKDIDDIQSDIVEDPVYGAAIRMAQTLRNQSLLDYASQVSTTKAVWNGTGNPPPGYVLLEGPKYGALNGKYVARDVAEDFKGYYMADGLMNEAYRLFRRYDNTGVRQFVKQTKTVFNPITLIGNAMSNFSFAFAAGVDPANMAANVPAAVKSVKDKDADYKYLVQEGVLGTDVFSGDIKTKSESVRRPTSPTQKSLKEKLFDTIDMVRDFYGATDDVAKVAVFRSLLEQGKTREQAAKIVYESTQNYNEVGRAYDFASKMPFVGNPYIKFKADLVRIIKNGITRRPLTTAAYITGLYAIAMATSKLSDEEEEVRKAREARSFIPKIPMPDFMKKLGIGDVPLVWQTKYGEVNAARLFSPMYVYDTGEEGFLGNIAEVTSYLPVQLRNAEEGAKDIPVELQFNDPLLGPLAQLFFYGKNFQGKEILNPSRTTYSEGIASSTDKLINGANYLANAWVPFYDKAYGVVQAVKGEEDFYGRVRNWQQALISFIIKVQDMSKPEVIKSLTKDIEYKTGRISDIEKEKKTLFNSNGFGSTTMNQINRVLENDKFSTEVKKKKIEEIKEDAFVQYANLVERQAKIYKSVMDKTLTKQKITAPTRR